MSTVIIRRGRRRLSIFTPFSVWSQPQPALRTTNTQPNASRGLFALSLFRPARPRSAEHLVLCQTSLDSAGGLLPAFFLTLPTPFLTYSCHCCCKVLSR